MSLPYLCQVLCFVIFNEPAQLLRLNDVEGMNHLDMQGSVR